MGKDFADMRADAGGFYNELRPDRQARRLGPDKGVVHMATSGIVNALWDIWARAEHKPVERLLTDLTLEKFGSCVDLRYVLDLLTRDEALAILDRNFTTRQERIRNLDIHAYPAFATSAGWLGCHAAKFRRLCRKAVKDGFRHLKVKVGERLQHDIRRYRHRPRLDRRRCQVDAQFQSGMGSQ